jgi:hypothetical protein
MSIERERFGFKHSEGTDDAERTQRILDLAQGFEVIEQRERNPDWATIREALLANPGLEQQTVEQFLPESSEGALAAWDLEMPLEGQGKVSPREELVSGNSPLSPTPRLTAGDWQALSFKTSLSKPELEIAVEEASDGLSVLVIFELNPWQGKRLAVALVPLPARPDGSAKILAMSPVGSGQPWVRGEMHAARGQRFVGLLLQARPSRQPRRRGDQRSLR